MNFENNNRTKIQKDQEIVSTLENKSKYEHY